MMVRGRLNRSGPEAITHSEHIARIENGRP